MTRIARLTLLGAVLVACAAAQAADAPVFSNARDLKWVAVPQPSGASEAALWGDAKSTDNGVLVRWKFNSKAPDLVRTQDVHIVVLTGTFTVEIAGGYREFGPGAFVSIPKGVKHSLGCEASGECRFIVHHPGGVEVTKAK